MKEKLKEYAKVSMDLTVLTDSIKAEKDAFEEKIKVSVEEKKDLEKKLGELQLPIIEEAKKSFEENGIKKLYGGLAIQERKNLEYDETLALKWAKEKDMFLCLDAKEFDKVAEGLKLDFVKVSKDVVVTFPKVLKLED